MDTVSAHLKLPVVGERIRLLSMPDDPAPMPVGSIGVVTRVREFPKGAWQVYVEWENSRSVLMMAIPPNTREPAPG